MTPSPSTRTAIRYSSASEANLLDLYLPDGEGPHPVVLLIHGGGWVGGSRSSWREVSVSSDLARAGFAVASIDYRLAPEHRWPAQNDDIRAALRFLADRAEADRLDLSRLAFFGGSAGGHLALMNAYRNEPGLPVPRAVAAFYAITDLRTRRETDENGVSTGEIKEGSAPRLLGCAREENPDAWREVSPVHHVRPGVPPTFLAHGLKDTTVNWEQSAELARALEEAGVPHELHLVANAGHTFDLRTYEGTPLSEAIAPALIGFLHRHLTP